MDILKLAIVIPIFNEEDCLPELLKRLIGVRESSIGKLDVRVIFVDDGSTDGSRDILREVCRDYAWASSVFLTRNFGHQVAVTAGLRRAASDFVAVMDADLQDPPELIVDMVEELQNKSVHVVYGLRIGRLGETRFKELSARYFYRLIRKMSGIDIPLNTGDFRVLDQFALSVLLSMQEKNPFLRGMIPWSGVTSLPYPYTRDPRYAGTTKYPLRKMVLFALNAIVAFSASPLRLLQFFGLVVTAAGFASIIASVTVALLGGSVLMLSLIAANLTSMGVVVTSIGIVGGYVHRIQDEVRNRPLYVIDEIL